MNPTTSGNPSGHPITVENPGFVMNLDGLRKQAHDKPTFKNIDAVIEAAKSQAISEYIAAYAKWTEGYVEELGDQS